ncbi:hypothetical protein ACOME3_001061 [Neoechinorhynchus agilis]
MLKYHQIRYQLLNLYLREFYGPDFTSTSTESTKRNPQHNRKLIKPIKSSKKSISSSSRLLLILIQACAEDSRLDSLDDALKLAVVFISAICVFIKNESSQRTKIEQLINDIGKLMYHPQYPIADLLAGRLCQTLLFYCAQCSLDYTSAAFCIKLVKSHLAFDQSDEYAFYKLYGHLYSLTTSAKDPLINHVAFKSFYVRYESQLNKLKLKYCKMDDAIKVSSLLFQVKRGSILEHGFTVIRKIFESKNSCQKTKLVIIKVIAVLVSIDETIVDQLDCKALIVKAFESNFVHIRETVLQIFINVLRSTNSRLRELKYWHLLCQYILDQSTIIRHRVMSSISLLIKEKRYLLVPGEVFSCLIDNLYKEEYECRISSLKQMLTQTIRETWFNFDYKSEEAIENVVENMLSTISFVPSKKLKITREIIQNALKGNFEHVELLLEIFCSSRKSNDSQQLETAWIVNVICESNPKLGEKYIGKMIKSINKFKYDSSELTNQVLECLLSTVRLILLSVSHISFPEYFQQTLIGFTATKSIPIIESSISCLSVMLMRLNRFPNLIIQRFYTITLESINEFTFTRSSCALGLFFKYFDLSSIKEYGVSHLFEILVRSVKNRRFLTHTRCRLLESIGHICHRQSYLNCFKTKTRELYCRILDGNKWDLMNQVVSNINEALGFALMDKRGPLSLPPLSITQVIDKRVLKEDTINAILSQVDLIKISQLYSTQSLKLRIRVVELLTRIIQQKLIHPEQFLPIIISGSSDGHPEIHRLCRHILRSCYKSNAITSYIKQALCVTESVRSLTEQDYDIGDFQFAIGLAKNTIFDKLIDILIDEQSSFSVQVLVAQNILNVPDDFYRLVVKKLTDYFIVNSVDVISRLELHVLQENPTFQTNSPLSKSIIRVYVQQKSTNDANKLLIRCIHLSIVYDCLLGLRLKQRSYDSFNQTQLIDWKDCEHDLNQYRQQQQRSTDSKFMLDCFEKVKSSISRYLNQTRVK